MFVEIKFTDKVSSRGDIECKFILNLNAISKIEILDSFKKDQWGNDWKNGYDVVIGTRLENIHINFYHRTDSETLYGHLKKMICRDKGSTDPIEISFQDYRLRCSIYFLGKTRNKK